MIIIIIRKFLQHQIKKVKNYKFKLKKLFYVINNNFIFYYFLYNIAEHIMRPRRSLFKPNLIRNFNSKDNIKIKK